jgi:hypothetical protein
MQEAKIIKEPIKETQTVEVELMHEETSAFEINNKEFHNLLPDFKVDTFLQKPFSIQQLNNVVEKISVNSQ